MTDQPLTNDDLAQIEARCEAATPGPWEWSRPEREDVTPRHDGMTRARVVAFEMQQSEGSRWILQPHEIVFDGFQEEDIGSTSASLPIIVARPEDADFLEHARTDVPKLLAEIRRLRGLLGDG